MRCNLPRPTLVYTPFLIATISKRFTRDIILFSMNKETIAYLISDRSHCSQVITGLYYLNKTGHIRLTVNNSINKNNFPYNDYAIVIVQHNNKKIVFDLEDGYWHGMKYYLEKSDYYFKRSYSNKYNKQFDQSQRRKIRPLGFNYYITYKGDIYYQEPAFKKAIKTLVGRSTNSSLYPSAFVQNPTKSNSDIRTIFFTRLFDTNRIQNEHKKKEIAYINSMRIDLLQALRSNFGDSFCGGLEDSAVARKIAPDLIVPYRMTKKENYLKLLHSCDIGIGSMGLHESIGWKTAEYIASSMAIVNEVFHYSVPGDFKKGINYLPFTSSSECIKSVRYLIENPGVLYHMRENNQKYYNCYLSPENLVWNALNQCK